MKQASVIAFCLILAVVIPLGWMLISATKDAKEQMVSIDEHLLEAAGKPTRILSADGVKLYEVSAVNRQPVHLSDVPGYVRNAVLAAEDKRFYEHGGVDMMGLARAIILAARERKASQGGSTLEMQLVKRIYNGSERTFDRKVKDIAYANELDNIKTKDQIFELYLNQVYFGEGAYGIEAASQVYFNKHVGTLTIGEAAMLARCVRRPSYENPFKSIKRAVRNRDVVLEIMKEQQWLSENEYQTAIAERPVLNRKHQATGAQIFAAPYFVNDIVHTLDTELSGVDLKTGGYTIYTTLDSRLQTYAEHYLKQVVLENKKNKVDSAAFIVIDKDGQILAEVGGADYGTSQYNIVTQGKRQPGSSFKPIVYATALANGTISEGDRLSNAPIKDRDRSSPTGFWEPQNSSKSENASSYSLADALALSINRPAIHTIEKVGPSAVVEFAHDHFGIESPLTANKPLALGASDVGPIEMAEAYSVFMLKGDRVKPFGLLRIADSEGQVIHSYAPRRFQHVLDDKVVEVIDRCLQGVVERGTGTGARGVLNARGKTGTTNKHRDAWFCGYTDGLLGVGWSGNLHGKPMANTVWGGSVTVKIWAGIMTEARRRFTVAVPDPSVSVSEKVPAKAVNPESWVAPIKEGDVALPAGEPPPGTQSPDAAGVTSVPQSGSPVTKPIEAPKTNGDSPPIVLENPDTIDAVAPKSTPQPPVRRSASPISRTSDMVEVEVCADTGLRASMYCPETVRRRFRKGQAPKGTCTLHRPN